MSVPRITSGVENNAGRDALAKGFKGGGGGFLGGGLSNRQFRQLREIKTLESSLRDQETANKYEYERQLGESTAVMGDIRATRDLARGEYAKDSQVDRFNKFRTANPETRDYNMNDKGGFSTTMFEKGTPRTRKSTAGQPRNTVKKIKGMVESGELSEAEAAGRYSNFAAHIGREKASTSAGKKPAPIRQGLSYVDKSGGGKQFSDIKTNIK